MTLRKSKSRTFLDRGTFKVILKEDVPIDGNILPGRFVLAIKSTDDGRIKYKTRFVIGGHRDKLKHMMIHSTTTLQPSSIRLLLSLAMSHGFDVWTSDVRQAYLQAAEPILRDVFITKPVPEFELHPSQCLQLLKPLYGLCESGDLWHQTIDQHHVKDLGKTPLRSDPALYIQMKDGLLKGISGGYVDDLLRAGDNGFKKLCIRTNERFDMGEEQSLPCSFTGFSLDRKPDTTIVQEQHSYLKKLEELPSDAKFSLFRSMRMKLAWLANTRPECLFQISQLAQVTETIFENDQKGVIRQLNRAVKYARQNILSLRIPRLNRETLRVIDYSDSSLANNRDMSSQLGHIVFLGDGTDNVVPIHFKSYKAKRVTRSAMADELIAFSDLFDVTTTLSAEMSLIMNRDIPVQLFTDSKSLFDVISKGSRTSEKRLMLDIAAARQGFKTKAISDIGFVRSSHNVADGLTKTMHQAALKNILRTGSLQIKPEQWVIRN
ncbi:unnamed protein product [Agarophyton chilense]